MSDVTRILEAIQRGDSQAADELLPLVYDELRRIAAYKMAQEAPGHTLQSPPDIDRRSRGKPQPMRWHSRPLRERALCIPPNRRPTWATALP